MDVIRSVLLFIVAGILEIGGGYLVWQWLREGRGIALGVMGALMLALYGVVPTLQLEPAFGRVYAAYGGMFIVLALAWGVVVDNWHPDRWDIAGAGIALLGMSIIMWAPRG